MGKETNHHHQAGAVPFRVNRDGEIEILLITSRSGNRWIFPKGWIEEGLSETELAALEAYEEAGVRGIPLHRIGQFQYAKRDLHLDVKVFLLYVQEVLADWPESHFRERRWFSLSEALNAHGRSEAQHVLERAVGELGGLTHHGGPVWRVA